MKKILLQMMYNHSNDININLSKFSQTIHNKRNIFLNSILSDLLRYMFSFFAKMHMFLDMKVCKKCHSIFDNFSKTRINNN
jgi:hypothetical protein